MYIPRHYRDFALPMPLFQSLQHDLFCTQDVFLNYLFLGLRRIKVCNTYMEERSLNLGLGGFENVIGITY